MVKSDAAWSYVWKQQPDVSRRCGAAAAVQQHKGRLRRAYTSVFCRDDKKLSRNLSARRASSRRGLFYWNLFRKAFLDSSRLRTRDPLLGARQGNRFVIVSFELTNLLSLLKIRRDRLAGQRPHFAKGEGGAHDFFHRSG